MQIVGTLHDDGQTVVVVTHDPNVAAFAQRVVLMRDGELVDEVRSADAAVIVERLVKLDE